MAAVARDLKQRVLACMHKLSDRDTQKAAAMELEGIAKSLAPETLSSFISAVAATDSSDKSAVRKQCLYLISVLAATHGNALSPHLSKLLSSIVRRLRDNDTSIRTACVAAASAIAANVTKPSFSTLAKPFLEALFTEQEQNSQIGTALCLSAVIEAAPEPDSAMLRKLLGRFEKLVKSDSFKAKAAVLGLIGSVIEVGGAANAVKGVVACLMEFLVSEDWAARKAAAEGLMKLALVERESLREHKAGCMKIIEAKRFDKVKIVRETMNQMVEVWKEIPNAADDAVESNLESHSSSKDVASDGQYPPGSRISSNIPSNAPQLKNKFFSNKSSLCNGSSAESVSKRNLVKGGEKKTGPAMFRKLDLKKSLDSRADSPMSNGSREEIDERNFTHKVDKLVERGDERSRLPKQSTMRNLFVKSGFRVVPCNDEISDSTVVASSGTGEIKNLKDSEDLSLIRKQLVQIENQQSNLMDMLQKFMGNSQTGMRSLETRVHGLELALDEISYDLAISTGRVSTGASAGGRCMKLPGADFFSSKLWRKTEIHHGTSRFTSSSRTAAANNGEPFNLEVRQYQGGHGFTRNPLAKMPRESNMTPDHVHAGL